jgi:uncharacterized SAM-binding protein YcdF (DUF218 family)
MSFKRNWVILFLIIGVLLVYWFSKEMRKVNSFEVTSWTEDQTADCGVVLTGGPQRIREGFDLLIRGSIQKLIISGVNPQAELRDIFPLWPYHGNLKEADVILEKFSQTTYGNAQQSLALVEALRCRDVVLVTGRLHMYRALSTFKAEFPPAISISPRTVVAGSLEPETGELVLETLKSMFYSFWAY